MNSGRGIGDWYANSEGRWSDGLQRDWENDDPVDRTPDSWLDRLPLKTQARAAETGATTSGKRPGTKGNRQPRPQRTPSVINGTAVSSDRPLRQMFISAVRDMLRKKPEIGEKEVLSRLRPQWPLATKREVRQALDAGRRDPMVRADAIRAAKRDRMGLSGRKLAARLRRNGWDAMTEVEVRAALRQPQPGRSTHRPPAPPRPLPTPQHRPDSCAACGVVPSALGTCRCS